MDKQQQHIPDDETTSNFSYTKSDNLNTSNTPILPPKVPPKNEVIAEKVPSESSSQYGSLTPTPGHTPKSSYFKNFNPPLAPLSAGDGLLHRDSFVSGISHFDNEVAQEVSVKAINQDRSPRVKYSQNFNTSPVHSPLRTSPLRTSPSLKTETNTIDDETDSVFSKDASIKLGKLKTKSTNRKSQVLEPLVSYSTNIDGAIPPRSNRRPKSETIVVGNSLDEDIDKFKKNRRGHTKGVSSTYSDDLDRLMERAGSMSSDKHIFDQHISKKIGDEDDNTKSIPQIPPITIHRGPSADSFKTGTHGSVAHSEISTEGSYETADNAKYTSGSSHSLLVTEKPDEPVVGASKKPTVPPRPSAENIHRARIASNQMKVLPIEEVSFESPTVDEHSVNTVKLPKKDESVLNSMKNEDHDDDNNSEFIEPNVDDSKPVSRAVSQPQILNEGERWASKRDEAKNLAETEPIKEVNAEPGPVRSQSAQFATTAPLEPEEYEEEAHRDLGNSKDNEKSGAAATLGPAATVGAVGALGALGAVGAASALAHSAAETNTGEGVVAAKSPDSDPLVASTNDDEFYDIEEPVLVSKPQKAKSSKDPTTARSHKKKTKSKRAKSKRTRPESEGGAGVGGNLKPFSYHTLINLLESINGTVIGEEFNQLNLPVKEKQLIEKIIDALSRLTSDMVIDDNRYEIGIQRLEKAHRVLEGFM